jgi:uncharacterized protein (DUF2235 family)
MFKPQTPKNIILLSDGTGNSAAAVWRTNVWRTYQALDLHREDQIAFYDDGVGTSAFKPLALLGSAFGWGMKRNVIHLYAFLCLNYKDGDQIYCFGFSRGAFTIRIVTELVTKIGLVESARKSQFELRREAKFVYRLYLSEHGGCSLSYPFVFIFRRIRDFIVTMISKLLGCSTPAQVRKAHYHQPNISFLGLWDTVAAYGLPMMEMTRAVNLYFWPMDMRDRILSDKVKRACHALALDDERTTFHPLLWNEKNEPKIFDGSGSQAITHTHQERISQVWFAGMHANVGGGYPDDGMAHVPLVWIIGEAERLGLKLKKTNLLDELKIAGDPSGRIYNSRQGIAGYYRYGPRRIDTLINDTDNDVIVKLPKIHESVFDRLRSGVGAYAPFVLPGQYAIAKPDGTILHGNANPYEDSTQALSRFRHQEEVWDWVWYRRVVFFATFVVTLYAAASPLSEKVTTLIQKAPWIDGLLTNTVRRLADLSQSALSGTRSALSWLLDSAPFVNNVFRWIGAALTHVTTVIVPPVIELADVALLGFLKPWLDAYKQNPTWIAILGCIIALLIWIGSWMESQIHAKMRETWTPIVRAWEEVRA